MSAPEKAGGERQDGKKRSTKGRASGRTDWRDASVWIVLALVLAIGFAGAYGFWLRTWRMDIANEQGFYVSTAVARIRDLRTRLETFHTQGTAASLVLFASSAARIEGALAQIPRRGPVEWKAEMIGLADTLWTKAEAFMQAEIAAPNAAARKAFTDLLPPLNTSLRALEQALEATVIETAGRPLRLNLTPEVLAALEKAITDARKAAGALPPTAAGGGN